METGLLEKKELTEFPDLPENAVDYGRVIVEKEKLYRLAFSRFEDTPEFNDFCQRERYWLDNYALFRVIKDLHDGKPWYLWAAPLRLRFPAVLEEVVGANRREIRYQKFLQFMFQCQWSGLKTFANENGVRIIGDIPYYVAYDSADAWASPELFEFDESGNRTRVAGVPPDYFSEIGQLWGNPLYRWDHMRHDGFAWWIGRIRKVFEYFDTVRLDHFRGFETYWAIPAESPTAQKGEWVKGPGIDFFNALRGSLGDVSIIAEDLGELTPAVEDLRWKTGFPGMKILQFAFDGGLKNPYLLHNIYYQSVTYTGTHDNDTSIGWFDSLSVEKQQEVCDYVGCRVEDFIGRFLRLAYMSPSVLAIVPFQDVLGLDGKHRMNKPGTSQGNWQWRYTNSMIDRSKISFLKKITVVYGREGADPPAP
jgi:4-alpha-glucanotransferase